MNFSLTKDKLDRIYSLVKLMLLILFELLKLNNQIQNSQLLEERSIFPQNSLSF